MKKWRVSFLSRACGKQSAKPITFRHSNENRSIHPRYQSLMLADHLTMCFMPFQVEWFMHQKEKKYKLFSTSFKDPLLSDQWYIVSCSIQLLST